MEKLDLDTSAASAVYSLIDGDSESIADEFDIGEFNKTHEFNNHIKIAARERVDPSDSLKELKETTDSDNEMEKMAASTFSRYTSDHDYGAVVQLPFTILHTPELYHQRAVQRKRFKHLLRIVIAVGATNLELTRSVVVSDGFVGADEKSHEINTGDGGIKLHLAARVDREAKHPLGVTVTEGETHESPQFEHFKHDVGFVEDFDSPIWVFDRGYALYVRLCKFKEADEDFIMLLESDARYEIREHI